MKTYDIDLNPVLEGAENEELKMIAKQMDDRWSESLTSNEDYVNAKESGNYAKVTELLAAELREFGGNTIANIARSVTGEYQGPPYREIVYDVAKKMKCHPKKDMTIERMEQLILERAIEEVWDKLSDEEKEEFLKSVGAKGGCVFSTFSAALHTAIRQMGFVPYKFTVMFLNKLSHKILGRGLKFATAPMAMKVLSKGLARSVNVLLWAWVLNDIASPALRVTKPCVILVALSRQRQLAEAQTIICEKCENICSKEDSFCGKCGTKLNIE